MAMIKATPAISPTKSAPTAHIAKVHPQVTCNIKKCEAIINIGFFFDGTNNNKDRDSGNCTDSNIARLHDVYVDMKDHGYSRYYIPGVGTKFPEIGEYFETATGSGCAFGSEARVIYALLTVFNALHHHCTRTDLFNKASILALCRNNTSVPDDSDCIHLAKLGVQHGLLQPDIGASENRQQFLQQQGDYLKEKLEMKKPRVVECFVDVFGFSRGAAEARVFCNWLDKLLVNGRLCGVPLHFRFLGIIDTVSSAGFWSGTTALLKNSTGGHGAWASAESLRVPTSVRNCIHMVAMHELRRNFPLDEIGENGRLQPGWVQYAYPGAHSDVGGGYQAGELGISVGDDSLKLSQIPLNHMLDCAIAAGAPMRRLVKIFGYSDRLAIHPDLARAYDEFISEATLNPRPVYEWLQPYLNWRWQVRNQFHTTNQVKHANQVDRDILMAFNKRLIDDAAAISPGATKSTAHRKFSAVTDFLVGAKRKATTSVLEPEAGAVLALAQRAAPTPPAYVAMFDGYVHDSLAGFNKPNLELTGYWRYRKIFLGTDEHTIASNQDADVEHNIV
jgi:uncharacterized protein (DUF2235 family)